MTRGIMLQEFQDMFKKFFALILAGCLQQLIHQKKHLKNQCTAEPKIRIVSIDIIGISISSTQDLSALFEKRDYEI